VSVRAEPEPDVDELKRQAEALRAEVETLQQEAQAAREEELRRNPPPPPKPKRERPKPVQRKTEEEEGFSLPSFNLFNGDDDSQKQKKQPVTDDEVELASKALACLPYLLPMSDAIPFGQYVINDFPLIALPLLPFAPFVALLNAIPFGGFIEDEEGPRRLSASRCVEALSRPRGDSFPGMTDVGGFFSEFECIRTASRSFRGAPGETSRTAPERGLRGRSAPRRTPLDASTPSPRSRTSGAAARASRRLARDRGGDPSTSSRCAALGRRRAVRGDHAYAIDATRHALLAPYSDELSDRALGRRGDAVLAVRAADPFEIGAVAAEVVAAVSCADAADLPPPPLVEVTRPPPAPATACSGPRRASRVCASVSASGNSAPTASRFAALLRAT